MLKKCLTGACCLLLIMVSMACTKYDDTRIWSAVNKNTEEIANLKKVCAQLNSDIASLKVIVTALQNQDYITNVATLADGTGYTITFKYSGAIIIRNGQNGVNGTNGANGADGQTPVIGVQKDQDGCYYWTINGEWLKDINGEKIKAEGKDGKDGTNGIDGFVPQLRIEDGCWFISYDGETWNNIGQATGKDAVSIFKSVEIDGGECILTLQDDSRIILPILDGIALEIIVDNPGTLSQLIQKYEDRFNLKRLKLKGKISDDDIKFLTLGCPNIRFLDISECDLPEIITLNPIVQSHHVYNLSLETLIVKQCVTINGCPNLSVIKQIPDSEGYAWGYLNQYSSAIKNFSNINLFIAEGAIYAVNGALYGYNLDLPSTLECISPDINIDGYIVCRALTPPTVFGIDFHNGGQYLRKTTLYVPDQSIVLYKESRWGRAKQILPISELPESHIKMYQSVN